LSVKEKPEGLSPGFVVKLDTLANVRTEMARLYRLAIKGKVSAERMTKFIYALKEIRGCIEAETTAGELADIHQRLVALTAQIGSRHA
jgi:hypothetical protein